jgi:hypothetical protein
VRLHDGAVVDGHTQLNATPSATKATVRRTICGDKRDLKSDVPGGIITHLKRECGGDVHYRRVVDVTTGSFETTAEGTNPHSGVDNNDSMFAAKNAAGSEVGSGYRKKEEDISHTMNNWM